MANKSNNTNIAKVQNGQIVKTKTSKTSGTQNTKGQSFYANTHLNHKASRNSPFEYDFPKYSAITAGTLDFDGQTRLSIFELYGRPQINFSFSANTDVFSSATYINMSHDIYKVRYTDVLNYRENPTLENYEKVKSSIENPFIKFTASTNSYIGLSSGATYTFAPGQVDKPLRGISEEIFEDKAMYFFNIRHSFNRTLNNYTDVIGPDERKLFYNRSADLITAGELTPIETGPWCGITAQGIFFTCMYPPSKPQIEDPRPESYSGLTFTPEFYFSNVSDGDEYVIEITYLNSNSAFTSSESTSQYFYTKEATKNSTRRVANRESTSFISETTRRASVPLIPGATYWYRIGNVKVVDNIFGVRQSIITYTDPVQSQSFSSQTVSYVIDSAGSADSPIRTAGGSIVGGQTAEYDEYVPEK